MPWVEPFVHQASDRHRRGAVGRSTRAVACALTNMPRPLELLHPVEKVHNFFLKKKTIQAVTSLFFLETNLSHDGPHRSQGDFCVSMIGRGGALRCKNPRHAQLKRRGGSKGTRMQ